MTFFKITSMTLLLCIIYGPLGAADSQLAQDHFFPYPYTGSYLNLGPNDCNDKDYIRCVEAQLNTCPWGLSANGAPPINIGFADFKHNPFATENWTAAISPDSKTIALSTSSGYEKPGDLVETLLYSVTSGTRIASWKVKWVGSWIPKNHYIHVSRPILFDAENHLHYVEKSDEGFDITNYDTKEKISIKTTALFVSLLKQKGNISVACTNDEHDLLMYNHATKDFLPFRGHTSQIMSARLSQDTQQALSCAFANVRLWDMNSNKCLRSFDLPKPIIFEQLNNVFDCSFAGKNNEYVVSFGQNGIFIWDMRINESAPVYHEMEGTTYLSGNASKNCIVAGGSNQQEFLIHPKTHESKESVGDEVSHLKSRFIRQAPTTTQKPAEKSENVSLLSRLFKFR